MRRPHLLPLLLLAFVFQIPNASAQPELYKKWHDECLSGDTDEIDKQIAKYQEQLRKSPDDHLAQAYLGSAYALRARETFWGPSKLKYLKKGQKLLDQAVENAPDDPRVRMVRAIGYYRIPERFKMRQTSIDDFRKITPVAKSGKGDLKINERQAILYYAWLANKEAGNPDAESLKSACHRLAKDSFYGKKTR